MGREEKHSGEELVVLQEVTTRGTADLFEALLRGEGIPCVVTGPRIDPYAAGPTLIRVRAMDLERAQEIIAEQA